MKQQITSEEEALSLIGEGVEEIVIDGAELMKEIAAEVKAGKEKPRAQIMRVLIEVGVKRFDGNLDIISSENVLGYDTSTAVSKIMNKIKPQVVDTMKKAREHVPSIVFETKQKKGI